MSNEIVLRKIQSLGVADPLKATAETVRIVLSAYFTRRVLDEPTFRNYLGTLNPSLMILMEGLKAFSLDQSGISHKVQSSIDTALSVLKTRLERPDITPLEAREIRIAILDLIREAREESNEQRILTVGLAAFATTALVAVAGGIMAALADRQAGSVSRRALGNISVPLLKGRN
jgi:hypothetical protein